MGKAPMLLVDVYDQEEKLISSNRPSFLRKQENERVEKLAKAKPKPKKAAPEVKPNGSLTTRTDTKAAKSEMEAPQEEKEAVNNG